MSEPDPKGDQAIAILDAVGARFVDGNWQLLSALPPDYDDDDISWLLGGWRPDLWLATFGQPTMRDLIDNAIQEARSITIELNRKRDQAVAILEAVGGFFVDGCWKFPTLEAHDETGFAGLLQTAGMTGTCVTHH